jgi:hypothetical protein
MSYSPPTESLNFRAVKICSCFCVHEITRALSGAVNIVHEIMFLPQALFYSAGCRICWSINLHPRAKLVSFLDTASFRAPNRDALRVAMALPRGHCTGVAISISESSVKVILKAVETSRGIGRSNCRACQSIHRALQQHESALSNAMEKQRIGLDLARILRFWPFLKGCVQVSI